MRQAAVSRALIFGALALGAIVMVFPLYWAAISAIRPAPELFQRPVSLVPSSFVWQNVTTVWARFPVATWAGNSLAIAALSVAITVFINILAGYTFAKFRFRGRNVLFFLILSALMIPIQVIIVPEFLIVSWLGLLNTWWGAVLPRAAEAFGIFLSRQFMLSIPDELIEAARLDGAGEFGIFLRVVLPLSRPLISVLVIFTFMWRWNDFAWPLVSLVDQSMFTVQLGLNLLKGDYTIEWTAIMVVTVLSLLPMLIVFLLFQRFFVQGIASTGLK